MNCEQLKEERRPRELVKRVDNRTDAEKRQAMLDAVDRILVEHRETFLALKDR